MITVGGLAISGPVQRELRRGQAGRRGNLRGRRAQMRLRPLGRCEGADDFGAFGITGGGVLTFNSALDYETPADADGDNTYVVTVMADDGTNMATRIVMVMVTNIDEMGEVTLSSDRPAVDREITATLDDPDEHGVR